MLPFEESVFSKYGAPMGRRSDPEGVSGRVHLRRVHLNGDYDKGGAYWGQGQALWCAFDSEDRVQYFRASSRAEAKQLLTGCTFYR